MYERIKSMMTSLITHGAGTIFPGVNDTISLVNKSSPTISLANVYLQITTNSNQYIDIENGCKQRPEKEMAYSLASFARGINEMDFKLIENGHRTLYKVLGVYYTLRTQEKRLQERIEELRMAFLIYHFASKCVVATILHCYQMWIQQRGGISP